MYRSAFFNFVAFMLHQIFKNHDLGVMLSDSAVLKLFLRLLEACTIPKLIEIKVINYVNLCNDVIILSYFYSVLTILGIAVFIHLVELIMYHSSHFL